MMIGGVATAAAVRTFPFRVFSFPKEVHCTNLAPGFFPSPGICANFGYPAYFVNREAIWETYGGITRTLTQEISIEEAKLMFPVYGHDMSMASVGRIHRSVRKPMEIEIDVHT